MLRIFAWFISCDFSQHVRDIFRFYIFLDPQIKVEWERLFFQPKLDGMSGEGNQIIQRHSKLVSFHFRFITAITFCTFSDLRTDACSTTHNSSTPFRPSISRPMSDTWTIRTTGCVSEEKRVRENYSPIKTKFDTNLQPWNSFRDGLEIPEHSGPKKFFSKSVKCQE